MLALEGASRAECSRKAIGVVGGAGGAEAMEGVMSTCRGSTRYSAYMISIDFNTSLQRDMIIMLRYDNDGSQMMKMRFRIGR